MFEEEQRVADPARAPVLDQRSLQRERLRVRHPAEAADIERSSLFAYAPYLPHPPVLPIQTAFGSQFSSDFFTIDMNSSATAPSMTRWS